MPFYKVPAALTPGDGARRRIRAPLRHSVNNGGSAATTPRDCDVIGGDCTASAGKTELQTSRSNQVV